MILHIKHLERHIPSLSPQKDAIYPYLSGSGGKSALIIFKKLFNIAFLPQIILRMYVCMYLAALGLNCGMQDLYCIMQDLFCIYNGEKTMSLTSGAGENW